TVTRSSFQSTPGPSFASSRVPFVSVLRPAEEALVLRSAVASRPGKRPHELLLPGRKARRGHHPDRDVLVAPAVPPGIGDPLAAQAKARPRLGAFGNRSE